MGLRIARCKAQGAFGSGMRNAARFGLAAALAVTLAYPVAGASERAFADEGQDVASEGSQEVVTGTLTAIDPAFGEGGFLVGTEHDFYVDGAFRPESEHSEDWYSEEYTARTISTNYTVASSNPEVASIEIGVPQSDRTSGWLHVEAKKAGKTTLTIKYRFAGEYGTYEAEQVVEVTVIGESNPITSIKCDDAVEAPVIAECAICGEAHSTPTDVIVPIELVAEDSSRPYTSDQVIDVKSSNEDVVWVGGDSCPEGDGGFHLHVIAKAMGQATVAITASTSNGDDLVQTASATMTLKTVDTASLRCWLMMETRSAFSIDDPWRSRSIAIEQGLASYTGNGLQSWWPYCLNIEDFDGFKGTVNGEEVTVLSAQSDNEDIATVVEDSERGGHRLVFSKGGTVHVTLKDVWGNEEKVTAIGICREDEAKKLSLSQNEITIKQGETVDVQNLVQGLDADLGSEARRASGVQK